MKKNRKISQCGMTLIEVALSLVILGLLLVATSNIYKQAYRRRQIQITYDNMDTIVQALSIYAETAERVPCPADPTKNDATFGWEYGVTSTMLQIVQGHMPVGSCGKNGSYAGDPSTNLTVGLVPFLTLGLSPEVIKDGWGNYFTYAVSPVFARHNDQVSTAPTGDQGNVHARCRSEGWTDVADLFNRSAVKARFCCMAVYDPGYGPNYYGPNSDPTDLVIKHTSGATFYVSSGAGRRKDNAAAEPPKLFDDLNTTWLNGSSLYPISLPVEVDLAAYPVEAPAIVLVSHGPNGLGAYQSNGARLGVPTSAAELDNQDNNQTFRDGPWNLQPGANYFDDIVRWMTQDTLMAAHGALSCQYP